MAKTKKKQYVIRQLSFGKMLYVEPRVPGDAGCTNWTDDVREARVWDSQKRAQNYADRHVIPTSGWNAQTDTQGAPGKRKGVEVVELVVD